MGAPPPIPADIGRPVGGSADTAPPPIPQSFAAAPSGNPPPPIPANIGRPVAGASPPAAQPAPTLLRDFGAGVVKGVEGLGRSAMGVLEPSNPMDRYYKPGAAVNKAITGTMEAGASAVGSLPGVKQATGWANATHPTGLAGAAAQGAGEVMPFAAGMLGPDELSGMGKLRSLAGLAGMGAASGVGQKIGAGVGQNVAGNEGAEVGGVLGALVGGIAPALTGYGAAKLAEGVLDAVPATGAAKARWAAQNLQHFEPNLADARERVAQPGAALQIGQDVVHRGPNGEILPGSAPTAVQLAGSQGLARLGEALKTTGEGAALNEAEGAQSAARASAVRDLGPGPGADPSAVASTLRKMFNDEDAAAAKDEQAAAALRSGAIASQPGATGVVTPYQTGAAVRDTLAEQDQIAKARTEALYRKIEERNPVVDMSPLNGTVDAIRGEVLANKGILHGPEHDMLLRAQDLAESPDTTWGQVNQLRSDLNGAITVSLDRFGQNTPVTRRLQMLKSGLNDTLADAAGKVVANSPEFGTLAGETIPEQVSANGVESAGTAGDAGGSEDGILRGAAGASNARPMGGSSQGRGTADDREGQYARPLGGADAAQGTPVGEPDAAAERWGEQLLGVAPPASATNPPFTAADAEDYQAALASHRARKQLFANPEIAPLLKRSGGDLAMAPEEVVKQIVAPGPKGARMARALKSAATTDPAILSHYQTAIGLDIRRAAVESDGTISLSRLNSWRKAHAPMLAEVPEVNQRLDTMTGAQSLVDTAVAKRAAVRDAYQTKAIQSFLNGEDPAVAMSRVLSGSPADARAFLNKIKADPQAFAGARQAMADRLATDLLVPTAGAENGAEQVRVAALKGMLRNPAKVQILREFLGPQAPVRLRQIVQDFDAYNSASMSRINAGGSRTTPLAQTARELAQPKTLLGRVLSSWTDPVAIAASALPTGVAGEAAAQAAGAMFRGWRGKHLAAATELLAKALADPKVFLEVTRPVPTAAPAAAALMRRARQAIANSYVNGSTH